MLYLNVLLSIWENKNTYLEILRIIIFLGKFMFRFFALKNPEKNVTLKATHAIILSDGCAYMAIKRKVVSLPLSQDWSDCSWRPTSHSHLRPMVSGTHISPQPPFKIAQVPEFMKQNIKTLKNTIDNVEMMIISNGPA